MPPGSSGCAAGGCLAGPAGALRPPKRRPGDVRPPLPPRPHLPPPPAVPAWSRVGWWGGGGPGWETEKGGRRRRPRRGRGKREPARAECLWPRRPPPPPRPGLLPRGAPSCRTRLGVRGSLARAGWKVPCRRRRRASASAAAAVGSCVVGGGGARRGEVGGVARGEVGGARPGRRGSPPAPGGGPASGRPPLPRPLLPAAAPHRHPPPLPARLAPRVRGRKPAPRPARPRSWPRSRGSRAPGGDPRDAAASSAVARPPPVRGRVVPRRGPVPSFRVGAGRALPPAGRRPPAASSGSSPTSTGGRVGGGSVGGGVVVAVRGACPAPGPCPSLPSSPPPRRGGGGRRRPRLSLSRLLPSPGPSPAGASGRGGRAGWRGVPSANPPAPARARLPPSETRPQIRRGDPLNLSILVSGGKETNQDSLSNGE